MTNLHQKKQLWQLYTSAPVGISKQIREQRELQKSYLKVRRDLNATSSQDEFAKWAKLRRQHDKLFEELEKKSMYLVSLLSSPPVPFFSRRWYLLDRTDLE